MQCKGIIVALFASHFWCSCYSRTYTIVGVSVGPVAIFLRDFQPIFELYLSEQVSTSLGQNLSFKLIGVSLNAEKDTIFELVESNRVDFIYGAPYVMACLESEFDLQLLATVRKRYVVNGQEHILNRYGGAFLVRADNLEINSVSDLSNKVVAGASMLLVYKQAKDFADNGMSLYQDVSQVRFLNDQRQYVQDLWDRKIDATLIGSDKLFSMSIGAGCPSVGNTTPPCLPSGSTTASFRTLNARMGLTTDDGRTYPFDVSSILYPNEGFAALARVPSSVVQAVSFALLAVGPGSTHAGPAGAPVALMWPFHSWQNSLSYIGYRDLIEAVGSAALNANRRMACHRIRGGIAFEGITCAPGSYKLSREEVAAGCAARNMSCERSPGTTQPQVCVCKPCRFADEVEIRTPRPSPRRAGAAAGGEERVCGKMEVCATMEQGAALQLRVVDNRARAGGLNVSYRLRTPEPLGGAAGPGAGGAGTYQFTLATAQKGQHILEIFVGETQIPNSPTLVVVKERDCGGRMADAHGACVCAAGTVEVGRACVAYATLGPAVGVPALVFLLLAGAAYVAYKARQLDQVWAIEPAELRFDTPPVVLGQGTFGKVVRAKYRGTDVAVKRTIPREARPGSGGGGGLCSDSGRTSAAKDTVFNPRHTLVMAGSLSLLPVELGGTIDDDRNSGDGGSGSARPATAGRASLTAPSLTGSFRAMMQIFDSGGGGGVGGSGGGVRRLRREFVAEMRLLARLRHPCIVTVMGAVVPPGGEPLLVMELMANGSLWGLLHNASIAMETELVLPILRDIMQGMRFLHAARPAIVHGDLKSANVLVDSNFRAKVADFGLSQKRKMGAVGTPYWMAPELLVGYQSTPETDVYAFGITLWEVATRADPYAEEEEGDGAVPPWVVLEGVRAGLRRPALPAGLLPALEAMMQDCWAQAPELRPTFEELEGRLRLLDVVDFYSAANRTIQRQKQTVLKSNKVLFDVFPQRVAEALMAGRKVEPERREAVTIYFSDIVGFTTISAQLEAQLVSDMLHRLYTRFDALAGELGVFKVETIGDAWMGVTNLVEDQPDHAARIARFSLAAVAVARETLVCPSRPDLGTVAIRVGFHSGPVVANVVGTRNPRYCLFGDTVNTASRMESNSEQFRVHCSEPAARLVVDQDPAITLRPRGEIPIKGKGTMFTYWVVGAAGLPGVTGPPTGTSCDVEHHRPLAPRDGAAAAQAAEQEAGLATDAEAVGMRAAVQAGGGWANPETLAVTGSKYIKAAHAAAPGDEASGPSIGQARVVVEEED